MELERLVVALADDARPRDQALPVVRAGEGRRRPAPVGAGGGAQTAIGGATAASPAGGAAAASGDCGPDTGCPAAQTPAERKKKLEYS